MLSIRSSRLSPTHGRPPYELDLLQIRLKTGPCVAAAQEQAPIEVADTRRDERWPNVMSEAVGLGVGSMLCVPLWVDERTLGSLSLYADRPEAFSENDKKTVNLFATLAAVALAGAQRAEQLQGALRNRDVIGQAKGILMERLRITEDAAFVLLAQSSQKQNRKLIGVARQLVDTGELPWSE